MYNSQVFHCSAAYYYIYYNTHSNKYVCNNDIFIQYNNERRQNVFKILCSIRIWHDLVHVITGCNWARRRRGNIILLRSKMQSAPIQTCTPRPSAWFPHTHIRKFFEGPHQQTKTTMRGERGEWGNIVYYIVWMARELDYRLQSGVPTYYVIIIYMHRIYKCVHIVLYENYSVGGTPRERKWLQMRQMWNNTK